MQRCTNCLCDTPDGSPGKCEPCRKTDAMFGTYIDSVHFVGGLGSPIGSDGDGDIDAHRSPVD